MPFHLAFFRTPLTVLCRAMTNCNLSLPNLSLSNCGECLSTKNINNSFYHRRGIFFACEKSYAMLSNVGKVVLWIRQSSFNSHGEMVRKWVDNSYEVVSELFFIMQMYFMFITSATAGNELYPVISIEIWWFLQR